MMTFSGATHCLCLRCQVFDSVNDILDTERCNACLDLLKIENTNSSAVRPGNSPEEVFERIGNSGPPMIKGPELIDRNIALLEGIVSLGVLPTGSEERASRKGSLNGGGTAITAGSLLIIDANLALVLVRHVLRSSAEELSRAR